ncbi:MULTISPECIES: RNA polymerase sigma factor [Brevundimonas]|uniref:RNA polymerase sigma factor n=1 Tax=Brevundimonas TaxID=41275 RepID=UPI001CD7C23B|nr:MULTISPECIES: RNA polymerase sigma factor [Brevundimonas]
MRYQIIDGGAHSAHARSQRLTARACAPVPGRVDASGFRTLSSRGRRTVVTDTKQLGTEAQDGINRLYRRYAAWLDRRLRAHVDAEAAADVVQETYIRAAPYALDDIRHPKAFLLKIALNLVRDESRREGRRRRDRDFQIPAGAEAAPQFDQVLLEQVIGSMPQLYRDVFVLSRFGGMTYPEIAQSFGISVKTVEWRMSRALEYCASRLDL